MADARNWRQLAAALRELHRTLLERARRDYEREHAVQLTPGELLRLLTTDAAFAWLRSLSELMVEIDLVGEADAVHQDEIAPAIRGAVEDVLSSAVHAGKASPFAQRYWAYVHDDPHVAMAHAGVRQAIAAWPRPQQDDGNASTLLHERHRLAEKARHLSRRK